MAVVIGPENVHAMSDIIQVVTAVDSEDEAGNIASAVVGQRLAVSAQVIGPIASTYWWNGDVEVSDEWLIVMTSRQDLFEELDAVIQQVHPYDVPELLAVPVVAGGRNYLDWLNGQLKRRKE